MKRIWQVLARALTILCADADLGAGPVAAKPFDTTAPLRATTIAATLDAPLPTARNAVWTASLLSAWKTLTDEVAGGTMLLDPPTAGSTKLNSAPDPRPHTPKNALYAAAGRIADGIVPRIQREMKARFPAKQPLQFGAPGQDGVVAYAYLEAGIVFPHPYIESPEARSFTDGAANQTPIRIFSLPQSARVSPEI